MADQWGSGVQLRSAGNAGGCGGGDGKQGQRRQPTLLLQDGPFRGAFRGNISHPAAQTLEQTLASPTDLRRLSREVLPEAH